MTRSFQNNSMIFKCHPKVKTKTAGFVSIVDFLVRCSLNSVALDDDRQPPKTPLELTLIARSKTSVLLQWTDVDYPKNTRLPSTRRYKVQVNELDSNQQIVKQHEYLTNNEQSYSVENLKALTNYEFAVRTIDGDLESDYSLAIEYSNAVYPIKQLNMITNNDPSRVTLTWQLPDDSNGIKSFHIYYNEQGEKGQEQQMSVAADRTQATVGNLKANTKYFFKIVSVNQFNDESLPETRLYKTPHGNDQRSRVVDRHRLTVVSCRNRCRTGRYKYTFKYVVHCVRCQ
jgi:hypothetical protein